MSLLPMMLREFEMLSEQMFRSMAFPRPMYRYIELQPRRVLKSSDAEAPATADQDGFRVSMDVQDFAPNEISVKTVDNTIVVEGKHEERQDDHGFITRQFTRRYVLPADCNIKDVASQLSSDGILTVRAPSLVKAVEDSNIRVIPIQQTGTANEAEQKATAECSQNEPTEKK